MQSQAVGPVKAISLVVGVLRVGAFSFAAKSGAVLWKRLENHVEDYSLWTSVPMGSHCHSRFVMVAF